MQYICIIHRSWYISLIIAFQRQALLKDNVVPGFASIALWKQVLICTLPLLSLFLSFYTMAFTPNSLALIIFSTGIMLNPLVSIPLSIAIESIIVGMKKLLIEKLLKKKSKTKSPQPRFKFTLSFYIALVLSIQIYLSHSWDTVRQSVIGGIENDTALVVMNSYENFLEFNQCECKKENGMSCQLPNRTRPERKIEDYLNIDLLTASKIDLSIILIGFLILTLIFVALEFCTKKQIYLHTFVLGPQLRSNGQAINSPDESEISDVTEKKPKKSQSPKKTSSVVVVTFCFVASIFYIISIFTSPIFFKDVYVLDQLFCKDGYYDQDNSSARLFSCSG